MAREKWVIDGFDITNGWVLDVEMREGLYATSAFNGSNATIPGSTGELWHAKARGASGFVLNVWLGGGNRSELDARYDSLVRLLMRPKALRYIVRTLADGTQRQCLAEVVGSLSPSPIGSTGMRLAIEFRVPDGLWYAMSATTCTAVAGVATSASPKQLTFTGELAKSTGPIETLAILVTGPIQNIRIDDLGGPSWLQYNTTVAAGHTVTFNCDDFSITATGGHSVQKASVQFSGSKFLSVEPVPVGSSPRIQMYGSGGMSAATNLSVTGLAAYLV
jgi:hypothetical protein